MDEICATFDDKCVFIKGGNAGGPLISMRVSSVRIPVCGQSAFAMGII